MSNFHQFAHLKVLRITLVISLLITIALFYLSFRSSSASASLSDVATTNAQEQMTDFSIAAPFWSVENGFVSTIEMKNFRVDQTLTVTPVLYPLGGEKISLDPVTLNPSETRQININDALAAKNLQFTGGSAEIKYSHVTRGVFGANLMLLNAKKSLSYNFQFRMPDTSSHLEGLWWFYDEKTDGFVAVQNTTDDAVTATPTLYVNQTAYRLAPLSLKAHEMQVIELRKELHQIGLDEASEGGIQINSSNVSAVIVEGGLTNANIGFSSPLLMHDTDNLAMRVKHLDKTLHALNVAIGADEPMMGMGLPAGTLMNPIINVRNIADKAIEVTPVFKYQTSDQMGSQVETKTQDATQMLALPKLKLNSQETKRFEMLPFWQAGQIPKNVSWGSLEFNYTGDDGSLIASVTSVDQSGTYVFDAKIDNRLAHGFEGDFWSTEGNNNTAITIKNITKKAAKAWVSFQYASGQGKYEMPEIVLQPGEARMIDVKMLKMERVPGVNDEAFPMSASFGGMTLREEAPGRHFLIDAVIYNPETATCGSCGTSCAYAQSIHANPSNVNVTVGGATASTVIYARMCNGTNDYGYGCIADYTDDHPDYVDVQNGCQAWVVTGLQPGVDHMTINAIAPGPDCADRVLFTSFSAVVNPTVGKIQYQSGSNFVDILGVLYVLNGTSVTFKAIPDPSTATFASGQPIWSGSSGASGTGNTISVTFNTNSSSTSDYKTVIATAGGSKTVNVIVFQLTQLRVGVDNFSGRSTTRFGVAEIGNLSWAVTPSVTAAQAGGLTWKVTSGNINIVNNSGSDGGANFTEPDSPETDTLKLEILSGPSKGLGPSADVSIVAPDGYNATQVGSNVRHTIGMCDIEFELTPNLTPTDVSFSRIGFMEGTANAVASGYYADLGLNGTVHDPNGPYNIINCNTTDGCHVMFTDQVGDPPSALRPAPCTNGNFVWNIPWQYIVRAGLDPVSFATVTHHQYTNNPDTVSIEKAGVGPFSKKVTDPTSPLE